MGGRDGTEVAGVQWADSLSVSLEGRSEDSCLGENSDPSVIQSEKRPKAGGLM